MKNKLIWLYGLPNSGKTTIANILKKKIDNCIVIEGDDIRKYYPNRGYSTVDRIRNIDIQKIVCDVFLDKGFNVIACSVFDPTMMFCNCSNYKFVFIYASFYVRKCRDFKHVYGDKDFSYNYFNLHDLCVSTNNIIDYECVDIILKELDFKGVHKGKV